MLHHPDLVFLDEPTSGLDPIAAVELREDLLSLKRDRGTTVFLNTHNLPEAERLCDLVGIIHKGRLLAVAPPRDLVAAPAAGVLEITGSAFGAALLSRLKAHEGVETAELSDGVLRVRPVNEEAVDGIIALVARSGAHIGTITRGAADLEDAFVALVRGDGR